MAANMNSDANTWRIHPPLKFLIYQVEQFYSSRMWKASGGQKTKTAQPAESLLDRVSLVRRG
jgi:hypothetical protein